MLVGEAPFPGENEEQIFEAIVHSEADYPYFLSITATAIMFVGSMLYQAQLIFISTVENCFKRIPRSALGLQPTQWRS